MCAIRQPVSFLFPCSILAKLALIRRLHRLNLHVSLYILYVTNVNHPIKDKYVGCLRSLRAEQALICFAAAFTSYPYGCCRCLAI